MQYLLRIELNPYFFSLAADLFLTLHNEIILQYRKGTSIRQVPEFGTSKHYRKAHGVSSGWIIYNDTLCWWPITSSNIFIFDHNYSVKGGLKVIGCIVQSAKYQCPYGSCKYTTKINE